jgi:hypothetical protein
VVVLAGDSQQGRQILEEMHAREIGLHAIVVLTGSFRAPPRWRRPGVRGWLGAFAYTARRKLIFRLRRKRIFRQWCPRVIGTGELNGARMLRDLRRLDPDWLVLGGVAVVSGDTIATGRRGVLNAHPALLPWVRGNGVVGHSLAQGIPVGASVHYVDRTIDTGAIVERRLLPVGPGAVPLQELERDAGRLAVRMMADVVEAILRTGEAPPASTQPMRYPLLRWPDAEGRLALRALAEAGRAHELYAAWEPRCPGGVVPPDLFQAPPPFDTPPLPPRG